MFEKNDPTIDLERYKRIIFEWCSGVNGILHVDLDRSEGWLYVKCKDKESAGQGKSAKVLHVSKRYKKALWTYVDELGNLISFSDAHPFIFL